jgi:hypothetical protein
MCVCATLDNRCSLAAVTVMTLTVQRARGQGAQIIQKLNACGWVRSHTHLGFETEVLKQHRGVGPFLIFPHVRENVSLAEAKPEQARFL